MRCRDKAARNSECPKRPGSNKDWPYELASSSSPIRIRLNLVIIVARLSETGKPPKQPNLNRYHRPPPSGAGAGAGSGAGREATSLAVVSSIRMGVDLPLDERRGADGASAGPGGAPGREESEEVLGSLEGRAPGASELPLSSIGLVKIHAQSLSAYCNPKLGGRVRPRNRPIR